MNCSWSEVHEQFMISAWTNTNPYLNTLLHVLMLVYLFMYVQIHSDDIIKWFKITNNENGKIPKWQ